MARGLIENKVELHLLTINTKSILNRWWCARAIQETSNYRSACAIRTQVISGVRYWTCSLLRSYFVSRFYFGEFERQLINILRQNRFDIVQLEVLFVGVYIDVIKHSSAKIVLRAHNVEHFIWQRHISVEKSKLQSFISALQNDRLKRFELEVMRHVDAIVPIPKTIKLRLPPLASKALSAPVHCRRGYKGISGTRYNTSKQKPFSTLALWTGCLIRRPWHGSWTIAGTMRIGWCLRPS